MATLDYIEGFEHQTLTTNQLGGAGTGLWDTVANSAGITFPAGRVAGYAMNVAEDGVSATYARRFIPSSTMRVLSYYLKVTALPSLDSTVVGLFDASFVRMHRVLLRSSGILRADVSTGASAGATNINDGGWHRVDIRLDSSTTTWALDWAIDGVDQGQITIAGQTAGTNAALLVFGSATTTHTAQFTVDDCVASVTSGDYPLGQYEVRAILPASDGTHNAGTNIIENESGTDIGVGGATAWPLVDEWTPNSTDYVQQVATGSGNYAEVNFQAATGSVAAVRGLVALFSSSTTGNNGTTRIVDSGGTTLTDIYSGSMNVTSLAYKTAMITAPGGGWNASALSGAKARVGFSTDASPNPRWSALMLQYAIVPQIPVDIPFINQAATSFAPTFHKQVQLVLLDQSAVTFQPKFNQTMALGFIDQSPTTIAPLFSIGGPPIQITWGSGWGGTPWGTTLWGTGDGIVNQSGTTFAPRFGWQFTFGLLDQSATSFAPQFQVSKVDMPFLDQSATTFTPFFSTGIALEIIDQSASTFAPEVRLAIPVTLPFIDQSATTFTPQANVKQVYPPLIDQSAVAFEPSFSTTLALGFIDQSATTFPVVFGTVVVLNELIDQSAVAFAPAFITAVNLPLLDQSATTFAPQFNRTQVLGFIDQSAQAFAPAFTMRILNPFIDQSPTIFEVVFIKGAGKLVRLPLLDQSAVAFAPTISSPAVYTITKKGVFNRTRSKQGVAQQTLSKQGRERTTISLRGRIPPEGGS